MKYTLKATKSEVVKDDSTYDSTAGINPWPQFETRQVLLRHHISSANDALADVTMDVVGKVILVSMKTLDGKPFFSADLLAGFIFNQLEQTMGVIAYDDDTLPEWTPKRTDWRLVAGIGGINFIVKAIKRRPFADPNDASFVIELFPASITLKTE